MTEPDLNTGSPALETDAFTRQTIEVVSSMHTVWMTRQ